MAADARSVGVLFDETIAALVLDEIADEHDDSFQSQERAREVARIVHFARAPSVFAICGSWGCGKSSFLRFLAKALQSLDEENTLFYFNAWRSSVHSNTIAALAFDIDQQARVLLRSRVSRYRRWAYWARGQAGGLAALARWLAWSASGLGFWGSASSRLLDEASKAGGASTRWRISREREELSRFAGLCSLISKGGSTKPFVIVDEIDRCSPRAAVNIVENIRMLFGGADQLASGLLPPSVAKKRRELSEPNPFKLVMAVDEDYVARAFENQFRLAPGEGHKYLSKFVSFRYHFPTRDWSKFVKDRIQGDYRTQALMHPESSEDIVAALNAACITEPREAKKVITYFMFWQGSVFRVGREDFLLRNHCLAPGCNPEAGRAFDLNRDGEFLARVINWALLLFYATKVQDSRSVEQLLRSEFYAAFILQAISKAGEASKDEQGTDAAATTSDFSQASGPTEWGNCICSRDRAPQCSEDASGSHTIACTLATEFETYCVGKLGMSELPDKSVRQHAVELVRTVFRSN